MIVTFDPTAWRELYPQFTENVVSDAQLNNIFTIAEQFIDNTETSPYPYDPPGIVTRQVMLNLMVCHMATLQTWQIGQSGALSSASQGSVSVSFATPSMNKEWFSSTPCGQTLWMMLKPYVVGGRIYLVDNYHPYG